MSDIDTAELGKRANALLALHKPGDPVVLPTVWDAWSAALAVDAGFAALTVGSHPVADSVGKPDGEGMTFDDLVTRVAQITAKVAVPISVDIESGYGEDPQRLIDGLLAVGAVGLNIEDTVHSEGKRLRTAEEHAALVGGVAQSRRSRGCACGDQRPHRSVPAPGRRRERPGRPGDCAAETVRRRRRGLPVSGGPA